ncbi:hypothetical protein K438DRAFT_1987837 [Mycena galopus ATCC 62051]|nr:hypothetical protein K438DRAFT_1987837 [Mycena galopus ATCC 62051]
MSAIKHWEHRFVFLIQNQTTVSFWTTVVTQSFGTIYCAVLVFVTQKLAMRHNLRLNLNRTLTSAHDCISAWAGLGSALATLFNQLFVPASIFGTLNIVAYLGCISVLHISIPAILSVEPFNTTVAVPAITSSFPEFANSTAINSTRNYMNSFPSSFLPWHGIFDDSQLLGLSNGSLYEVLETTTSDPGNAQISALGFNVSCGEVNFTWYEDASTNPQLVFNITNGTGGIEAFSVYSEVLFPNQISIMGNDDNSIYIYSTALVVDSEGQQGSSVILNSLPTLNLTGFTVKSLQIQVLRCFRSSLVAQSGMIDTRSNTLFAGSLYPNIHKNYSAWVLASKIIPPPQSSTLLGSNLWSEMLGENVGNTVDGELGFFIEEEYLMTYLGLNPFVNVSSVVSLHDIENALSSLLAMIFWTGESLTSIHWR